MTNHFGLKTEEVVPSLRDGSAQESLFRVLGQYSGLGGLQEHQCVVMDPQARVVNSSWREVDNSIRRLRERSRRRQVRLRLGQINP